MSRLTGADAYSLMEAYNNVYAPQELTEEQVWEEVETWVNSLLEEGYDLSDYTWEEMYESYINEDLMGDLAANAGNIRRGLSGAYRGAMGTASNVNKSITDRIQSNNKPTMPGLPPSAAQPGGPNSNKVGSYTSRFAGNRDAEFKRVQGIKGSPVVGSKPAAAGAASAPARPSAGAPARPAATAAPKPAATAPAAKPAGSAMDQFAKANPKLAASAAERDRTRGTSATTNPLMKDMKSRLPAPKTPSPSTAKTGFDLAKKGVNLAAGFDMFDVVKGYLIGEGYADTEEAALAIMANMSEEWRQGIVEERAPGVRPYTPNRLNPLPKEKPLSGKKGDGSGYGADEKFKKPDDKIEKPGTEVPAPKKGGYGRIFSNIPYGIGAHANRERSRNSTIRGMDPGAPRSEKLAPTEKKEKKKPSREIVRKRKDTNESYDIILSYLLDEGYANTVESAEAIISNMSEDWILSIIQ